MISLAFLIFTILFVWVATNRGFSFFLVFVDMPSLLFILLGIAGYFFLFGRKEFGRGVKTFFAFSFPPDDHSPESGRFFLELAKFTQFWGLVGTLFVIVLAMVDLNPDTIGHALACSLLCVLYALGLSLFVFLPIGLRLSPPKLDATVSQWLFIRLFTRLSLFGLAGFLLIIGLTAVGLNTFVQQTVSVFNPDSTGDYTPFFSPHRIWLYWDVVSLVLMVGSWWLFRMASGKRRKWIAAPIVIAIGIFWSILGLILTLANFDPETIGTGFFISMLTTLYGFLAAAGFLIADMVKSGDYGRGVPSFSELSEGTEQGKEILDRAGEKERR